MSVKKFHSIISSGGYPAETQLGTIYAGSSWTNLNDFTANGITPAVTNGNLVFTGGTAVFTRSLDYNRYSKLANWKIVMDFTIQNTQGGFVGVRSLSTWQKWNFYGSWSSGFISMQGGQEGSMTTIAASVTALAASVGHSMRITLEKTGQSITLTVNNITAVTQASYTHNFVFSSLSSPLTPNTGKFVMGCYTAMTVTSFTVSSTTIKNAKNCFVVDSIGEGYCVTNYADRYTYLVGQNPPYGSTVTCCGQNDGTPEGLNLMTELLQLNARTYVMCLGINDIGNGVASATYLPRYASIVSQLQAAGKRVVHLKYYSTAADVSPLWNYIQANYSSSDIIDTTVGMGPSDLIADGVHMNTAGNLKFSNNIINSGKL